MACVPHLLPKIEGGLSGILVPAGLKKRYHCLAEPLILLPLPLASQLVPPPYLMFRDASFSLMYFLHCCGSCPSRKRYKDIL